MDEDLSSFKTIAGKLRYSNDIYRKGENGNDAGLDRVRNGFLQEGLLISTAVTPELARNLKSVCQRLGILEINVDAFVYASKDIQAECFGSGSTKTLIRFSSALIELLDADEFEKEMAQFVAYNKLKFICI